MNVVDYDLTVLAKSTIEINAIAARLKEPSAELLEWCAEAQKVHRGEALTKAVTSSVAFEAYKNLGYVDDKFNMASCFRNCDQKYHGVVGRHLFEASKEYPDALFLLTYRDEMGGYSGKAVILGGKELRHTKDDNQQAQSSDWALLDIFAPYMVEYRLGVPYGSLWNKWLHDIEEAVGKLKTVDKER